MSHMCHIEIKCVTVMCDCYEMAPSQTDEIGVGGGAKKRVQEWFGVSEEWFG